jgi:hypothetical protein
MYNSSTGSTTESKSDFTVAWNLGYNSNLGIFKNFKIFSTFANPPVSDSARSLNALMNPT